MVEQLDIMLETELSMLWNPELLNPEGAIDWKKSSRSERNDNVIIVIIMIIAKSCTHLIQIINSC